MCAPDAPAPPDPKETSAAQTGTSVATSVANTLLGNVNRVGADGSSLTYSQSGTHKFTDPFTNKTYDVPTFTATERLSAPAQAIFNDNLAAKGNLAGTAKDQSAFLRQYLGEPWQADTSAIEGRLFDLGSRSLDPKFARQRDDLATRLSNQGIKLGSEAYTRAMGDQSDAEGRAYNDLLLRGRGQAFSELQTQRNQPINEITALLSGSQVSQPGYSINNPSPIPTTDNAGLINANYGQRLAAWQQDAATRGGALGGLFNLGGTLGSAAILSDRNQKKDIKKVGKTKDGQDIYKYRYKSGGPIQMGLMAQEVEKKKPGAVKKVGGIRFVDYGKALQ